MLLFLGWVLLVLGFFLSSWVLVDWMFVVCCVVLRSWGWLRGLFFLWVGVLGGDLL